MKAFKFLIFIIILIFSGCRHEPVKKIASDISSVRLVQMNTETISIPVHSTGILASSEEMKLSFKTGGIIAKIPVKEGDKITKGEILATLNLSEIDAQVSLALNGFDKATRDYKRTKNLYKDSVTTLEQLQNATTALNLAKSTLDIAQFNQNHSTILAPGNGIILKQFVRTNELVAPGYPVFLFGSSDRNWKVKTSLSDRDIVRINFGDSANVILDAWPDVNFPARIDQVGAMSNPMTGTYEVEMTMDKSGYRLATGFVAEVTIFPARKETYTMIPVSAIVEADGETGFVYSVSDSLMARKIKIEIVTVIGSKAAIKGNLIGIKEIVSDGVAYLRDGEKVKVVK